MKQVSIKWVSHESDENKNKTHIRVQVRRKSEHVHLAVMAKNEGLKKGAEASKGFVCLLKFMCR